MAGKYADTIGLHGDAGFVYRTVANKCLVHPTPLTCLGCKATLPERESPVYCAKCERKARKRQQLYHQDHSAAAKARWQEAKRENKSARR